MDSARPHTVDVQAMLQVDREEFPFPVEASLEPLVRFLAQPAARAAQAALGRLITGEIGEAHGLAKPIDDLALSGRQQEALDLLMTLVFPPGSWDQEYGAAMVPFRFKSFYATPSFTRILLTEDGTLKGELGLDRATATRARLLYAYRQILDRVYQLSIGVDYPLILATADPDTGLDRHFKLQFDGRFLEVEPARPLLALTDADRQRIRANPTDLELLARLMPAGSFVFRGFTILRATDVTDQEVLSWLKRDLIDRQSIVSPERFREVQARLRTLFRRPDLRLGLAAIQGERVFMLNHDARMEHACLFADSVHHRTTDYAGSVFERAVREGVPLIVPDLPSYPGHTWVEEEMLRIGVQSLIVAPLHYQDRVIGTLELESSHAGSLDGSHLPRLGEVLPLFAMAVHRSVEELGARVQAFINEQCTAIHPAVAWRFRTAALDAFERARRVGLAGPTEMEAIVFDNVYPLYGLSDVRGSSTQRALAIQSDLIEQLGLAREALAAAHHARALPILDQLGYRIAAYTRQIEASPSSGDELGVTGFVLAEIEPLFAELQRFGPDIHARVEAYRAALDPRLGTIYRQRKRFEDSITLVNETISSYLDLEQQAAQAMFPHYYERQKTDGVDYQIYVGSSLVEGGVFDPLYLKNLRLWQLMVTCGVATRAERVKNRLPVPLETAHLVLVQQAPLSIRFRFDEKRFDVDGAYNIRYEIVKKRIDKAAIRGTNERVTQPGRIAIVYAHPAEAAEYREYIEYLQYLGYLRAGVEDLELEELQGVPGLRALRVSVHLDSDRAESGGPAAFLRSAASARTA